MSDGPFIDIGMHAADGNVNWDSFLFNGVMGGGPYAYASFSTSVLGSAAQYSERWWWRDFGKGGLWDLKIIHVTGFDVGIYSVRLDEREIVRFDGYSLADVNNIERVFPSIPIGPGRHKLTIQIRDASPSTTGLKFYPAIQGILFRKVGPFSNRPSYASPKGTSPGPGGQVINLIPLFSSGNTNWDTLTYKGDMAYGYELASTGAQNAARYWDLDLAAGQWVIDLMVATFASAGIISVQVDGVTQATIDTYSGSTVYAVRKTATLNILGSGTHRLQLLMATKNGSSSSYFGDLSNLQLRRVGKGGMQHRIVNFTTFWSTGDLNWHTIFAATFEYGGDMESDGTQNAARWWNVELAPGTYDFSMLHRVGSNRGIYSVRIDDREVGTIDGYNGSNQTQRNTLTGFVIPSGGTHKLSLVMATKNQSSNYYGTAGAVQLRRTA